MYKIISSIILLIIFTFGCDSTEPEIETYSDIATVDQNNVGFSFSHGKSVTIPNNENIVPDILILAHIDQNGDVLGVFFAAESYRPAFYLVKEFSQSDSALTFYSNLLEVPDSNYQELALPVNLNQIWAVKTSDSKFGKILILSTEAKYDSVALNYKTVSKFKWKFQSNGSRNF
jgi:hypothetical protein